MNFAIYMAAAFLVIVFLMRITGNFSIDISENPVSLNTQEERIARAIATAEGFFTDSTLLQSKNNPVGLKLDGSTLTTFATVFQGWEAAYNQIRLILTNRSNYYNREMSIAQIAPIWTGGDRPEAWATIVARELGVDKNTPLYKV